MSSLPIQLIVGLGNPGKEYQATRHNIGFAVLDCFAERKNCTFAKQRKWKSEMAQCGTIRFLKPLTYMNLSGRAVQAAANFFQWKPQQILVIYDEVDLPLGRIQLRNGGGAAGHNGIKSMISSLGTGDFNRMRLGVGRPTDPRPLSDYVLGKFSEEEQKILPDVFDSAYRATETALIDGMDVAMNQHNEKKP